ncbi:hypothetical protein F2P79_024898 [Pimephales promelas]|nr:hypothetical protein F2P79_024898 [Pimephales promelas]
MTKPGARNVIKPQIRRITPPHPRLTKDPDEYWQFGVRIALYLLHCTATSEALRRQHRSTGKELRGNSQNSPGQEMEEESV